MCEHEENTANTDVSGVQHARNTVKTDVLGLSQKAKSGGAENTDGSEGFGM